jgi:hypothetical protein
MPDAHMHRHGHRGLTLTFSTNPVSVANSSSCTAVVKSFSRTIEKKQGSWRIACRCPAAGALLVLLLLLD